MGAFRSYFLHFASVIFMASVLSLSAQVDTSQQQMWLVLDTLDLHLADPSYEVSFFKDEIIFLSSSHQGVGRVPMDQAMISARQPLFNNDPFPYPPSGITFTRDHNACYASRYTNISGEFKLEKIYFMSIDQGNVSDRNPLSFTRDSCRYLHPALSSSDSLMVLSSDRLPTNGGLDLFVSRLDSTGWSLPLNLGSSINTNGHERFPFLDRDNNLWFSSTGHSGYGAYDIYVCPFNGMDWEQPQNLGISINTQEDEIGFSIHPGDQAILFTRMSSTEGLAFRILSNGTANYSLSQLILNQSNLPVDPVTEVKDEPVNDLVVEAPTDVAPDPQRLVFRVQILSSTKVNSTPSVVIDGSQYTTFEYHYKGSYRITVGEFETVQDANNFRLQCRRAGYSQAFVAAFRGEKRETDPSVFKN